MLPFFSFVTTNLVHSNFCLLPLVGTANKMNESSVLATRWRLLSLKHFFFSCIKIRFFAEKTIKLFKWSDSNELCRCWMQIFVNLRILSKCFYRGLLPYISFAFSAVQHIHRHHLLTTFFAFRMESDQFSQRTAACESNFFTNSWNSCLILFDFI